MNKNNLADCTDFQKHYWLWSEVRRLPMSAMYIISYFCAWKTTNILIYYQPIYALFLSFFYSIQFINWHKCCFLDKIMCPVQTWGQILSKVFKCKCKYFYFLQMQILFKSISNTFKYFDRYAISRKNRNNKVLLIIMIIHLIIWLNIIRIVRKNSIHQILVNY